MAGGGAGAYLNWQGCLVFGGGKLAFAGSVSSGAMLGVSASAGTGPIVSNAREPTHLPGASLNAGGSAGVPPVGAGVDRNWEYKTGVNSTSAWGGVSLRTPLPPAEAHFGASGTWVSPALGIGAVFGWASSIWAGGGSSSF